MNKKVEMISKKAELTVEVSRILGCPVAKLEVIPIIISELDSIPHN